MGCKLIINFQIGGFDGFMNSLDKYMAKLLFGGVKGFKFTKKNLIYACIEPSKHRIMNTSTSTYSEKFIKILSENEIEYFKANKSGPGWIKHQCSINQFWELAKDRKSKFIIILN